jgi:hypothetical protein
MWIKVMCGPSSKDDLSVNATVIGPLAVHRIVLMSRALGPVWTVTHIRSGRAIYHGLCCRSHAIALAQKLQQFNWNFTIRASATVRARVREKLRPVGEVVLAYPPICADCLQSARKDAPLSNIVPKVPGGEAKRG